MIVFSDRFRFSILSAQSAELLGREESIVMYFKYSWNASFSNLKACNFTSILRLIESKLNVSNVLREAFLIQLTNQTSEKKASDDGISRDSLDRYQFRKEFAQ